MDKWIENTVHIWKKENRCSVDVRKVVMNYSCPKCGYSTNIKTRYCPYCGEHLKED